MAVIQQVKAMQIIDPHLHLFNRAQGQYHWLSASNPPFWADKEIINRDFGLHSIQLEGPLSLEGFVHIEAGFDNQRPEREIQWLESLHVQDNTPKMKTIASINLQLPSDIFEEQLNTLINCQSVVGIRHILDDQATQLLQSFQVITNLELIAAKALIFECQFSICDDSAVEQLVKTLMLIPSLKIVINHAGFASLSSLEYTKWLNNIKNLAQFDQLFIKASGWEMCDRDYTLAHIQKVTKDLIAIYGAERIMLASNFPLCLFTQSYQELWQSYTQLNLSSAQLEQLMASNARTIYQF
jgi:predicted TIM-barrel fold metal-dependent hydrolase